MPLTASDMIARITVLVFGPGDALTLASQYGGYLAFMAGGPGKKQAMQDYLDVLPSLAGANDKQSQTFKNAETNALQLLAKNADCAGHFGGFDNAAKALTGATYKWDLIQVGADVSPTGSAPASWFAATNPSTNTVTINAIGHFFLPYEPTVDRPTGQPAFIDWTGGSGLSGNDYDAFVLLHELGHLTGRLGNDVLNSDISDAFNSAIMKDCFGKK